MPVGGRGRRTLERHDVVASSQPTDRSNEELGSFGGDRHRPPQRSTGGRDRPRIAAGLELLEHEGDCRSWQSPYLETGEYVAAQPLRVVAPASGVQRRLLGQHVDERRGLNAQVASRRAAGHDSVERR